VHLKSDLINNKILLNCSPLERPPLLSGQISDAMRQQNTVVSLEESSLGVFYYLVASEIWSDKRGGISRGEQFSSMISDALIAKYY
jgi:hypothetical protein